MIVRDFDLPSSDVSVGRSEKNMLPQKRKLLGKFLVYFVVALIMPLNQPLGILNI